MDFLRCLAASVLLTAASSSIAQTLAWRIPIYAQVDMGQAGSGSLVQMPFDPFWTETSLPAAVMQLSNAGMPGLVLAGAAETGPPDGAWTPVTPYLAKASLRDGHALWTWQLHSISPALGRIWEIAVDTTGDVIASGGVSDGTHSHFLLVKVDGATGETIWRVNGAATTFGYGVALDADENVLVTFSAGPSGQIVAKYAGATGSLLWSVVLPDGTTTWDDFQLVVDQDGEVIAAGSYAYGTTPSEAGVQVAKLANSDGAVQWRRRFTNPQWFDNAGSLRVMPGGDVFLKTSYQGLICLTANAGQELWRRQEVGASIIDLAVDSNGRLFSAGSQQSPGEHEAVDIHRLDPLTGASLWDVQLPIAGIDTFARTISTGLNGNVLVQWSSDRIGALSISADTGDVLWQTRVSGALNDGYPSTPVGMRQAGDGSAFVGGYATDTSGDTTWTLFKLTGSFSDDIFANGCD